MDKDNPVVWSSSKTSPEKATRELVNEQAKMTAKGYMNRTDSGGGSIVWRTMESWQRSAITASGGIHRN